MKKTLAALASAVGLAVVSLSASADGEFGTAAEARAMLDKAVSAVKADKSGALALFAKGEGGFKDRDLYPFCGGPDGNFTAHPSLNGKSMKDLKDKTGQPIGEQFYGAAREGQVAEVAYMWPRPGTTDPVKKVSLVTRVGDQVCAVGYYQ
ncbi:MAG: cache domain-containing protein [Comamonadaceae bacterium]|nr:cache domain-containing protein [Comamonadaceae bacterium]